MKNDKWTTEESLQFWAAVIQDRVDSGLTIKDYCSANNIKIHTYYYWQRKVRSAGLQEEENLSAPADEGAAPDAQSISNGLPEPVTSNTQSTVHDAVIFNLRQDSASVFSPAPEEAGKEAPSFIHSEHTDIGEVVMVNKPSFTDSGKTDPPDKFSDVPITIHAGRLKILISQKANPDLAALVVRSLVC